MIICQARAEATVCFICSSQTVYTLTLPPKTGGLHLTDTRLPLFTQRETAGPGSEFRQDYWGTSALPEGRGASGKVGT